MLFRSRQKSRIEPLGCRPCCRREVCGAEFERSAVRFERGEEVGGLEGAAGGWDSEGAVAEGLVEGEGWEGKEAYVDDEGRVLKYRFRGERKRSVRLTRCWKMSASHLRSVTARSVPVLSPGGKLTISFRESPLDSLRDARILLQMSLPGAGQSRW